MKAGIVSGVRSGLSGLGGQHGQEVSGGMSPPGFVTSPRFSSPVQGDEHLSAAMLPAQGGVGVVAVFLDALLEFAAGAVLHL